MSKAPFNLIMVLMVLMVPGFHGPAAARVQAGDQKSGDPDLIAELQATQKALDRRDFAVALKHLEQCLKRKPNAELHFLAARTARRADLLEKAEHHLKECERLNKQKPEALQLERMLLTFQKGDETDPEAALLALVGQKHPQSTLILESLARGYLDSYQLTRALACLEQWLTLDPRDVQPLLWHGEAREGLGDFDTALEDYRRVLRLVPDHFAGRLKLAELLLELKMPNEALEHLERLHKVHPRNQAVGLGVARCRLLLGDAETARKLLDQLLADQPKYAEALFQRGKISLIDGEPAEGEKWLRKALALDPHNFEYLSTLCHALKQLGRIREAEQCQARFQKLQADRKRLYELVRQEAGHTPDQMSEVGAILMRQGKAKQGLRWLFQALKHKPTHRPTHQILADYYEQIGKPEKAAVHRKFLK